MAQSYTEWIIVSIVTRSLIPKEEIIIEKLCKPGTKSGAYYGLIIIIKILSEF